MDDTMGLIGGTYELLKDAIRMERGICSRYLAFIVLFRTWPNWRSTLEYKKIFQKM
jgi:hypothetical protein